MNKVRIWTIDRRDSHHSYEYIGYFFDYRKAYKCLMKQFRENNYNSIKRMNFDKHNCFYLCDDHIAYGIHKTKIRKK